MDISAPVPALVEVRGLTVAFRGTGTLVEAVRGIDLDLEPGLVHALVGESGSGKSATALALLGLHDKAQTEVSGSVTFGGRNLVDLDEGELVSVRGRGLAMIFQEPRKYLDPSARVGEQMASTLGRLRNLRGHGVRSEGRRLLEEVELRDVDRVWQSYPHQLSGGMCQRVMVALALAGNPAVLVADEPTSALDANRRADIEDLIRRLARDRGMAVLFISHDLRSVARVADRISVLYAGRIVERTTAQRFLSQPDHPYTRLLRTAIPDAVHRGTPLQVIRGSVPTPGAIPRGCPFHPRCPYVEEICLTKEPVLRPVPGQDTGRAACLRLEDLWQYW